MTVPVPVPLAETRTELSPGAMFVNTAASSEVAFT